MGRILVIDDDRQIRALLRDCLEGDGHAVVGAEDGAKGLAVFEADPADIVLIDLFMPGSSGWDTIRKLQKRAPGVPFIIISGGAPLEGLRRGIGATLTSVREFAPYRILRKPLDLGALRAAVAELLSSRPAAMGEI